MRNIHRTAMIGALALGMGSCTQMFGYREGGAGMSLDQFTYVSTAYQPKTVSLVDTRSGDTLWSVEVPVGQQLVVRFHDGKGGEPTMPDSMDYSLMDSGTSNSRLESSMSVPSRHARLLKMEVRESPEHPPSASAD